MTYQLSKEDVNKLFEFVESKNVEYLDVQHEIVDHLASSVEKRQSKNSTLSLDQAIKLIYADFPVTGFAAFVSTKQSAMSKFWKKRYLKFMLSYLKLPKVIIAGIIVFVLQLFFQNASPLYLGLLLIVCIVFSLFCNFYSYKSGYNFKEKFKNKILAIDAFLEEHEVISFFILIPTISITSIVAENDLGFYNPIQSWILSISLTIILLWIHAYTFQFPKMLMKELTEKYSYLDFKLA